MTTARTWLCGTLSTASQARDGGCPPRAAAAGSLLEVTMVPGALPRLGEAWFAGGADGEEGRRAFR
jgi:hypothetical protein